MAKLKYLLLIGFLVMVLPIVTKAQTEYYIEYKCTNTDSATIANLQLQQKFIAQSMAVDYIGRLPSLLQSKGFITASIDSVRYDSLKATVKIFVGDQYQWAKVTTRPDDEEILQAVRFTNIAQAGAPLNVAWLQSWEERILDYLEQNGYPFAKVYLDSVQMEQQRLSGALKIDRGILYKIDSIRVYGNAKINNEFLQRYLDIPNGSLYNKKKLQAISKKLSLLTYVQEERPSNITMLGTGSVLNVYLKQKKSSQINVLVGFLPNSNAANGKKMLVTGEANILLQNALGAGETIGLNWQQLQQKSPKLNILYEHPYIFRSPFGLRFSFDMFRRDSIYLNINMNLGATYQLADGKSATIFIQKQQTIVNGLDLNTIQQTKKLPQEGDINAVNLGISYNWTTTDYRFNPRKGSELTITTAAGTKKLKKNNQILELKDPYDPSFNYSSLYDTVKLSSYVFRTEGNGAHYFPLGKQSTLKTGVNVGILQSGSYYINELFRIGGYRLLRGFDEESQYVSHYAIGSAEYHYLIGQNSFFFLFADGGWARHPLAAKMSHTYIGTGAGLALETKAGIFNLAWAVGKRDDTHLNLRQSKVHLGFVNYF